MHGLEVVDGQVAFALRGAPAWHGLANHTFGEDEHVSTSDMLREAKLANWDVRLEPVESLAPADYRFSVSDPHLVLRTNPFDGGTDVLALVGSRYKVVQNEQLFDFGDALLDGGASWESGGSIKDGRQVFGSLVLPKEIVLDPSGVADKVVNYLVVATSHDGTMGVQALTTPVRVVCQNTLNLAFRSAKQSYKIRHTSSVDGRIAAAREALQLSYTYADEFEKEARAFFETAITDKQFTEIVTNLYPKPEDGASKAGRTKWTNKVDLVNQFYYDSPTQDGIRGTAWGALNALTERLDYGRKPRGGNDENMLAAASGFDPIANAERQRIYNVVKVAAGV
jgi:phage/plasmid-like protein (TIGR03299 family)